MPGGPSLYDALGVPRGAGADEIRKSYLTLSRKHHPDKGGDPEEFKKIQKAYEVLSDEGRRKMYDMTGSEEEGGGGGPFGGGGGGGFPFPFGFGGGGGGGFPFPFHMDMDSLFGGMGKGRSTGQGQKRPGKPAPKVQEIPISLHDFYYGKEIQLQFERQKFCESCKGEGYEKLESCGGCGGSGMRQSIVMMGPGMQGVMRGPCPDCGGKGKKASGTCGGCKGAKTKPEEKILKIRIEPGMRPGEVFVFAGACSDQADWEEVGDVHIVLQEADEDTIFRRARKGSDDLEVFITVTLRESLLGGERILDGHPGFPEGCKIQIPQGIQSGEVFLTDGAGLVRRDGGKGSLRTVVTCIPTAAEKEALKTHRELLQGLFT